MPSTIHFIAEEVHNGLNRIARNLFSSVAAGILPAVEPRLPARRNAVASFNSRDVRREFRAAGCPPSTSGGTPDATPNRYVARAAKFGAALILSALAFSLAPAASAQLPAFPGAEGFGRFASGGRGGSVYYVTTTNDSGPGSFRDAVSVSGRTVVFSVGGIIDYQAPRYAPKPNITIAGQTAPGDGVTIYGNGLSFSGSHNNICRFIRVREGINGDSGTDAMGIANGHDMIFDHVSVSWGRDETFSVNGSVTNITIQSSIIAQGLQTHSAGGLIQTEGGVSILRSLYIDNDTRNPKVKFLNEFVNNVVCNWETIGYNMGGDSAGDSYVNMFNNYFIRGPNSGSTAIGGGNENFHIYATNNWYDGNRNGALDGNEMAFASYGSMDLQPVRYAYPIVDAYPPLTALKLAISDVGTSQRRDAVDERLMTELTSWGVLGQTISSEYAFPMSGPGLVRNGVAPVDTDLDGMPDYWELGTGSNPSVANHNDPSPSGSGYTRLEDYLNWLAEPHGIALTNAVVQIDLRQFTRGFTNWSPVYSVANPTHGTVDQPGAGHVARFTPAAGYSGPASFTFTVVDSNGSTITRLMNLFFTSMAVTGHVTWRGDGVLNNWNVVGDENWFDGATLLLPFHQGDTVTFDNTGYTTPPVNLIGSLQPTTVNVNADIDYVLAGNGALDGAMSLNKSGLGTLRLNSTNGYTGATVVSNGTVLVNGGLLESAVTVRNGGAAGGCGFIGNGLVVQSGGAVIPGDGPGFAGTLTISNALAESGGVTNRFDLSDDPTGGIKANDRIDVIGNLTLNGANVVLVTLLDGPPGDGVYTLFTYTGSFVGSLANLSIVGAHGTLTNPPGAIALIVSSARPPVNLVWAGDGVNNIWDQGTNANWRNEGVPDRFYFLDSVRFDESGSANPAITLSGTLTPESVAVDATNNYAFNGAGRINGATALTKTNSGILTIATTNDYTGPTIIGGGTLSVTRLANGGGASGIGAAGSASSNLVLYGSTLRYTGGTATTDRGMTLNGGGTLEISASGTTLTHNGIIAGTGPFIKAGPGRVTIATNNSYSVGTILGGGTLALANTTARDGGLGSGSVTFNGGTLSLYGYAGSTAADFGTFNRALIVPAGQTGTLLTPPRYTLSSALTGGGTLNLTVDYVRGVLSGNWSQFTGTIVVTGRVAASEFRVANSSGYGNATLILLNNVVLTRSGGATTIVIGALGGSSGAKIASGNSTSSGTSYRVGGNNADAKFDGVINNDGNTVTFTKVGTGSWTLTAANGWSGGLTINGGTVLANNASGSATGPGAIAVNSGATLGGTGFVAGAVTVNSNGEIAPGSGGIGTLTINNSLTLNPGAVLDFEIGATSDRVSVTGALSLGGTLNVTNLPGFGVGTNILFSYGGALSGALAIGSVPAGYSCAILTNIPGQVRLAVAQVTPPSFAGVSINGGNLLFNGTGGAANGFYYVLASTNMALPITEWVRVATNQFDVNGNFSYTNGLDANLPESFYRLQLP